MSLNRKRRIFRGNPRAAAFRGGRVGVLAAAAGGAATAIVAASLFVRSSDAPALAPPMGHVAAPADRVAVLDGDTLRVGNQVVRLAGIVAPARGSVCGGDGARKFDCGSAAANALAGLLRSGPVECAITGHDTEGRASAACSAGETQLNEVMVLDGWARAATAGLREPEAAAQAARRGLWRTGL